MTVVLDHILVQSVHILPGENRSGAHQPLLAAPAGERGEGPTDLVFIHMVTGTHPRVNNRRGAGNLLWRQSVMSRANFLVGVIPQRLNILGLNLCELANYYTIIIHKQTNKHS